MQRIPLSVKTLVHIKLAGNVPSTDGRNVCNDSPVDALVEVFDVDAVQVVQIMDVVGQVPLELVPADLDDLVRDVALHHLHKVHHLVSAVQRERAVKTQRRGK